MTTFSTAMGPIDSGFAEAYPCVPEAEGMGSKSVPERNEIVVKGHLGWLTRSLGIPPWGQVLIVALVVVGAMTYRKLDHIDRHLARIDGQIEVLPFQLSKELLSQADLSLRLGHADKAARILDTADALITQISEKKTNPPPLFIDDVMGSLDAIQSSSGATPDLSAAASKVRVAMANYSSAVQEIPPGVDLKTGTEVLNVIPETSPLLKQLTEKRAVLTWRGPKDVSMFSVAPSVKGTIIKGFAINMNGGIQVIDNIHWIDVVFINTHIKYQGGPVQLENVKFINCTFEVPLTESGDRFSTFAALRQQTLTIGRG